MACIDREDLLSLETVMVDPDGFEHFCVLSVDVRSAHTANVAPVVHGKWELQDNDWFDLWKCSACGEEWGFEYDPTTHENKVNFCPNCGAHMKDGE